MRFALLFFIAALAARPLSATEPGLADATIVVFNKNAAESAQLAKFYAEKRGIPRDHLVPLACSEEEEISREAYDKTIAEPLRAVFKKKKWWTLRNKGDDSFAVASSSIRFVALIKGMPLKIRASEPRPGEKSEGPVGGRNEASVDSELSLLARAEPSIAGAANNPYFQSYERIMRMADMPLLLVCRLDAPSAATVRQMITDAVETERTGLWGRAYVDAAQNRSSGYEIGDEWMNAIVKQLRAAGVPVVFDGKPETFAVGYPMNDVALYYGWYAAGVTGPFASPLFRFQPGAVAVHIHSFSASTLRDPNGNWVGPLLARGATAVVGNVYEPFLQLTNHLDILNDRLLHGFTFAESAYISIRGLSWMTVMVGDPLYRPYANWLQLDGGSNPSANVMPWKMYHEFAVKNVSLPAADFRVEGRKVASAAKNGAMLEDLGMQEAQEGNDAAATAYFQQARSVYTQRDDIVRVVLAEAESWRKQGNNKRAGQILRNVLGVISDGPTAALLKKLADEMDPPTPGSPTKP